MRIIFFIIALLTSISFGQNNLLLMNDDGVDYGTTPLDSLKAYWALEDVTDSYGSNDLTNVGGGTTFTSGKVNNAATFVNTENDYLSINDNANLSMGDIDFTIACWVNATSLPTDYIGIVTKYGSAGNRDYMLWVEKPSCDPDAFNVLVSNDGTANNNLCSGSAISTSTWYFLVMWHDATANTINIQINNGTAVSKEHTTGVYDSGQALYIGRYSSSSFDWNGLIDEVAVWKRILTSDEKTYLYNSGSGRTYTGGKIQ